MGKRANRMNRVTISISIIVAAVALAVLVAWRGSVLGTMADLRGNPGAIPPATPLPAVAEVGEREVIADVYARYPFSDRSFIAIAAGSDLGISVGMPVLANSHLFGKVIAVSKTLSEVETIFSPAWRSSVYIGENLAPAVLYGGEVPSVGLISKGAGAAEGMRVVNADPVAPLKVPVGTLGAPTVSSANLWSSAPLSVPFSVGDVRSVWVIKHFP